VAELVQRGAVPVHRLEISLGRRHANAVCQDIIVGSVAADTEIGGSRCDERLRLRQNETFRDRWCTDRNFLRQAIALIRVEDSETFQARDRAGLITVSSRPFAFIIGNEAICVEDCGAMFTLAHMAAERERLTKSEPELARKAALVTALQRINTLMPLYCRPLAPFLGIATDALPAEVPQG
jgi:hypothetical protein